MPESTADNGEDVASNSANGEAAFPWQKIAAAAFGNFLEWYDFGVYGALANELGALFFPEGDDFAQLMKSFCVFAAGFVMRPLGGIVVGYVADRSGRKHALFVSILMMLVPTFIIGCLPTYSQVGIPSTLMLITLRFTQGLSIGGEYVTALVFAMEHAPDSEKPFWGALSSVFNALGFFTGSAIVFAVRSAGSRESLQAYGWRVCFWLGLPIGAIGLAVRRHVEDSGEFSVAMQCGQLKDNPVLAVFKEQRRDVILMVGIMSIQAVGWYQCFVWMEYVYGDTFGQDSIQGGVELNTLMQIVPSAAICTMGILGYRVNVARSVCVGTSLLGISALPAFLLINLRTSGAAAVAHTLFAMAFALVSWGTPFLMHSSFESSVRVAALGICYNMSLVLFGGTTPLICSGLMRLHPVAPSLWLVFVVVLSLFCLHKHQSERGLQESVPFMSVGEAASPAPESIGSDGQHPNIQ